MSAMRFFAFPGGECRMPRCALTLASAGPMRLGTNDDNRARAFRSCGVNPSSVVALSQIHSRVVRVADRADLFAEHPEGDGLLAIHEDIVPSITVADCMPIYVFDPVTSCFGVLHSGWKGTGIVRSALELAADEWGAKAENFRVVLGPHIRSCCYTVDAGRAELFTRLYGPSCVVEDGERMASGDEWPYRLSLAEANRSLCRSLGVRDENILDVGHCTACDGEYGSSRREGSSSFTHMLAFVTWH
jgi:polyphenol oxidase